MKNIFTSVSFELTVIYYDYIIVINFRKASSVAKNLFLGLAVADLATCLVVPIHTAYHLFGRDIDETFSPSTQTISTLEIAVGVFVWAAALAPCAFTGFLSITRYHQIRYPLKAIREKLVYSLVFLAIIFKPAILILVFAPDPDYVKFIPLSVNIWLAADDCHDYKLYGFLPMTHTLLYYLSTAVPLLTQVAAVTASILTIIELGRNYLKPMSSSTKNKSLKGSIKILLANTGSVLLLVFMLLSASSVEGGPGDEKTGKRGEWTVFMAAVVSPVLSSFLNPLIYIILTPSARKSVRNRVTLPLVLNNRLPRSEIINQA